MTGHAVGIDIGGTKTLAVALDASGEVVASASLPTVQGPEAVLHTTTAVIASVRGRVGSIDSVGIGIPGVVDPRGRVRHAVNVGLTDLDLAGELEQRLGLRPSVGNDVSMAALGAAHQRHEEGSLAFLNLGTGLAVGVVIDGRLYTGGTAVAGEIGHLPVEPGGPDCKCGQRGCLELYLSGSGLARLWPTEAAYPAADLFARAGSGEVAAVEVRDAFVSRLAWAVQLIVVSLDVAEVVLGGGVTALGDELLSPLLGRLRQEAAASPFVASLALDQRVGLIPAGYPAAAVGAAIEGARSLRQRAHARVGDPVGVI